MVGRPDDGMAWEIVRAVADTKNCNPTDLAPLHDTIDVDALEALFERSADTQPTEGRVVFTYEGCEITVSDDADIEVVES